MKKTFAFICAVLGFGLAVSVQTDTSKVYLVAAVKNMWTLDNKYKIPFPIGLWQGIDGSRIMGALDSGGYGTSYWFDGELIMDVHGAGCYTPQAMLKVFNRNNEYLALAAESASVARTLDTKAVTRIKVIPKQTIDIEYTTEPVPFFNERSEW